MEKAGKKSRMSKAFSHGLWAFIRRLLLKKGLLDGWAGFVIALSSFEVTFYKYAKYYERASKWTFPESPPLKKDD